MTNYAHPEVLVDATWLEDHLNDANVRIVEVDLRPQPEAPDRIPGAVFWNIFADVLGPDLRMNLDPRAIEKLLSRSGITNEMTVVAYGSYPGTGAWIFWLLKLFGHRDVRVLNGGHQMWVAQNRPVTAEVPTFAPTEYRAGPIDENLRVCCEEVLASIEHPDRILLDVRSRPEYRGEQFLMNPPEPGERAGHIPGAVHLEHLVTLNEDGTFKSSDDLHSLFRSQGVTPEKEIFPYCAIGARAGYIWFVLKYLLGYPHVRNYDGSWNEWSRLPDAAIET